jgi:hypothetical protein
MDVGRLIAVGHKEKEPVTTHSQDGWHANRLSPNATT